MATVLTGWKRTHMCGVITEKMIGSEVCLMGWVQRERNLGSLVFVDLRDREGVVQVVFNQEINDAGTFAVGAGLSREFVLAVRGTVAARSGAINDKLPTGRIEVNVAEARLINRAETPPIYIEDGADEAEAVRLKYRYLDLRRPSMQRTMRMRARVLSAIRRHMEEQGFVDVETPILTKSTPEGARDFLVPSRIHPGGFYALPQSPQIYKQLLMLAGFDKYYQVARCFRDEDNRADRQPEFTQVDLEMSFVEPEDVQRVVEGTFAQVFQDVLGVDIPLPLPCITWRDAMDQYGSDKPDTRFDMRIVCVDGEAKGCGFKVFEDTLAAGGTVRGIRAVGAAGSLPRKEIDALGEFVKTYRARGLAWALLDADGSVRSSFAKNLAPERFAALCERMEAKPGDALFFIADSPTVALTALGQLRLRLGRQLGLIDTNRYDLLWITEFPLLEWNEEAQRYHAMHHPFTSPMAEDLERMETVPGSVRANAYDLVLNGVEMGSGSIRIHDSVLQERMFALLGFTHEQAWSRFGFLLEAFQYGTPPHGGFAYGVDRLVMVLAGRDNLREVLAFPKVQNASCLMMETPSTVAEDQLEMLKIKLDVEEA
ncbi:MAG: aspartate--tRNA ligase [Clostridia bacterium]|nr:aspartate--tRNA ligase [Clostridia bacterium]